MKIMKNLLFAVLVITAINVNAQEKTQAVDAVVNSYLNYYQKSDEPILKLDEVSDEYNKYKILSQSENYYIKGSQRALVFDWDKDGSYELITFLFDNLKFKDFVVSYMTIFGLPEVEVTDDYKYITYKFQGDYSDIKLTNMLGTASFSVTFTSLK